MPGWDEETLALQYYLQQGSVCLSRRQKWAGVEVDLLLRDSRRRLILVEVKSDRGGVFRDFRLSRRQRDRLLRAAAWLASHYGCSAWPELALVDSAQRVHIYDMDGLSVTPRS